MSADDLPKIDDYTAAYWREVAKDYGIRLPAGARKAEVYSAVIARMRLHAAMLNRQKPR